MQLSHGIHICLLFMVSPGCSITTFFPIYIFCTSAFTNVVKAFDFDNLFIFYEIGFFCVLLLLLILISYQQFNHVTWDILYKTIFYV